MKIFADILSPITTIISINHLNYLFMKKIFFLGAILVCTIISLTSCGKTSEMADTPAVKGWVYRNVMEDDDRVQIYFDFFECMKSEDYNDFCYVPEFVACDESIAEMMIAVLQSGYLTKGEGLEVSTTVKSKAIDEHIEAFNESLDMFSLFDQKGTIKKDRAEYIKIYKASLKKLYEFIDAHADTEITLNECTEMASTNQATTFLADYYVKELELFVLLSLTEFESAYEMEILYAGGSVSELESSKAIAKKLLKD